jgi:membrane protein DedA with SNARE-associated domain
MAANLTSPLALPTGVLAGIGRYPSAVAGEILWTGAFVGLGYWFGASWSGLLETVEDSLGILVGLCLAAAALGLLWLVRSRRSPATAVPEEATVDPARRAGGSLRW